MDCAAYRRFILAEPRAASPELCTHLDGCLDCTGFRERLLRFDGRLERALRIDGLPDRSVRAVPIHAQPIRTQPSTRTLTAATRRRGLALAAGIAAAAVVTGLWLGLAGRSLAADVIAHMADEPAAWKQTEVAVPPPRLDQVLRESRLRLGPGAGVITYANSCLFRGHRVPHLVVQTADGPVTVMVLVHEIAVKSMAFNEQGYRGVIVPIAGHGSLAVLARVPATSVAAVDAAAARVRGAIDWAT